MKRRTKKKKPSRFQKQISSSMKTTVNQKPKMNTQRTIIPANVANSLLDKMEDGHEYESLLKHKAVNIDLAE